VDLVLHGHLHESREYYRKGIRFLNAGATLKNEKKNSVKVNYVRLLKEEIIIDIEHINVPIKEEAIEFTKNSGDFVRLLNYSESEKEIFSS
jgi:predicted phosphodiesterase